MASILENAAIRNAALPITVEQYHRLGEAGIIPQRTELLHGVILEKMVKSPEHSWLVQRLVDWLRAILPPGLYVRQEQPLTFEDSEPEPDIAVVRGTPDDHRLEHPATAALVIEVAVSSEAIDREKGRAYAVAGVSEYWLILPHFRAVEVSSQPKADSFQHKEMRREGDVLSPFDCDGVSLAIAELFKP